VKAQGKAKRRLKTGEAPRSNRAGSKPKTPRSIRRPAKKPKKPSPKGPRQPQSHLAQNLNPQSNPKIGRIGNISPNRQQGRDQGEPQDLPKSNPKRSAPQQHQQSIPLIPPVKKNRPGPSTGPMLVNNHSGRNGNNPPPTQPKPPRSVSVLVVAEERARHPAHSPKSGNPNQSSPTAEPENRPGNQIHPIPVRSQPNPHRLNPPIRSHQPGTGRPDPGIGKSILKSSEPPRRRHGIVIEPGHEGRRTHPESSLNPPGVPGVDRKPKHLHSGRRGQSAAAVSGRVVHHQNPMWTILRGQSGETPSNVGTPPPGNHHDRRPDHGGNRTLGPCLSWSC
jgi:hypothetical protein